MQNCDPPEPVITLSAPLPLHAAVPPQPRAIGVGGLSVRADETGQTRLAALRHSGSTKLVFPHAFRRDIETVLVNTAGGITGGDRFTLDICVQEGAALTLTTQAAERAYAAQPGETAQALTQLHVAAGARLNWLPQELILFDRCALHRRLEIDTQPGARLLMVEPVVFGRALMRETLRDVNFHDRIRITRAGKPLYLDAMRLYGDAETHLARPGVADGAGAMASVVLVCSQAAGHLDAVRGLLPATAGASLLAKDVLVIRQLAIDSFTLRRALMPVLEHLSQNPLPTSWRL